MSPKEKQTYAAIGLFGGLVVYAFWSFVWTPMSTKSRETRQEVQQMESRLNEAVQRAQKLHSLFKEVQALRREVEELSKQLPEERELPGLLRLFTQQSRNYGLNIAAISPGGFSNKGLYDELNYTINVATDLHSLGRFMTSIGKGKRILIMRDLNMTAAQSVKDASKTVTASFRLLAFKFNG